MLRGDGGACSVQKCGAPALRDKKDDVEKDGQAKKLSLRVGRVHFPNSALLAFFGRTLCRVFSNINFVPVFLPPDAKHFRRLWNFGAAQSVKIEREFRENAEKAGDRLSQMIENEK